jgi:hypothetical protein
MNVQVPDLKPPGSADGRNRRGPLRRALEDADPAVRAGAACGLGQFQAGLMIWSLTPCHSMGRRASLPLVNQWRGRCRATSSMQCRAHSIS